MANEVIKYIEHVSSELEQVRRAKTIALNKDDGSK